MSGLIYNTPSQIIRQLMIDLSLGADGGTTWPVFVGQQPDAPDDSIVVFDTAPKLDGRLMVSGEVVETYGIQIRVRARDQQTGQVKASLIADTLDKNSHLASITVEDSEEYGTGNNSYLMYCLDRRSGPFALKDPDREWFYFTINYLANLAVA